MLKWLQTWLKKFSVKMYTVAPLSKIVSRDLQKKNSTKHRTRDSLAALFLYVYIKQKKFRINNSINFPKDKQVLN